MDRIRDKTITIRKSRKCFGCLEMMNKGDKAWTQTNAEDGKIYSLTICTTCQGKVAKLSQDDEFFEGEFKKKSK